MNRPAGKAKTRKAKAKPLKPYIELDDGLGFQRFESISRGIFTISSYEASQIRVVAKAKQK
jgi:hypothetical protein